MTKRFFRIFLDVVILLLVPLLYDSRVLSLAFHEIAGLIALLLLGAHLSLNWKWLTGIVTRWTQKCLPFKTRLSYLIDMSFLGTFLISGVSGLLISRVLFAGTRSPFLRNVHVFFAALSLLLFGLHLGFHWSAIAGVFKKALPFAPRITKTLGLLTIMVIVVLGVYSILASPFLEWLTLPLTRITDHGRHTFFRENHSSTPQTLQSQRGPGRGQGRGLRRNADPRRHFRVEENALPKTIATFVTYASIAGFLAVVTTFLTRRFLHPKPFRT